MVYLTCSFIYKKEQAGKAISTMAAAKIHKPKAISGYPEWLPEVRAVELEWLDTLRSVFESYGFCSIETPVVEELAVLAAKGETADKEIYTISRLNAEVEESGAKKEPRLGLHYDLTVPLARYVAQHFSNLVFPFKRYQMQKVWRGERPQEGRFREFYQCDIDVLAPEKLSLEFDVEIPLIMAEALAALPIGDFKIKISNRKILQGYLEGLGIENTTAAIREIDKLDKLGEKKVTENICKAISIDENKAKQILKIALIDSTSTPFLQQVEDLGVESELLTLGLEELSTVFNELKKQSDAFVVDLSIARGFDYYTGTILEASLTDYPEFSTIAAGGRYDDLASSYTNNKLPGIGISIGLSRLFAKMLAENKIEAKKHSPTQVLVAWMSEETKEKSRLVTKELRAKGINVEMFHSPIKLQKQIRYADRKGIEYVWFPGLEDGQNDEVKNMATGEQISATAASWEIS